LPLLLRLPSPRSRAEQQPNSATAEKQRQEDLEQRQAAREASTNGGGERGEKEAQAAAWCGRALRVPLSH
jgi:hypothetical protein